MTRLPASGALEIVAAVLAGTVVLAAATRAAPHIELSPADWACTGFAEVLQPVQTAHGPAVERAYTCNHWSRR